MLHYDPKTDAIGSTGIPIGIPETEFTPENTAFHDGIQFAWDNTSIGLFKTCPRKYYYTIVCGYVHRTTPPALAFGIHLHTLLQTWHKLLGDGTDRHTALTRITRLAGLLGETLPSGDTARTKETLVRAIIWYLDQFWDDKAVTVKLAAGPAVEHHFWFPFMTYNDMDVFVCGHIDRIVHWQSQTYVCDYKTTKYSIDNRFFEKFKPSTQMPLYVMACHLTQNTLSTAHGVIIDGIQLGVNFCRYMRSVIPFSLEEINEYIESLKYWISQAMDACKKNHFPPNEESCDKYGGCLFREICAKPPARRTAFLEGNFVKRVWNPLTRRS
jgi:hypothetical protein